MGGTAGTAIPAVSLLFYSRAGGARIGKLQII